MKLAHLLALGIATAATTSFAADLKTPMDFSKPGVVCSAGFRGSVEVNSEGKIVVCTHEALTGDQLVGRTGNFLKTYCMRLLPSTAAVENCIEENLKKAVLYVNEFKPQE